MDHVFRDVRYALRRLRRRPGLLLAGGLLLTLAVGSGTAIFAVLDAVLLAPLPFAREQRLAALHLVRADTPRGPAPLPFFLDLQQHAQSFDGLAAYFQWSANLAGEADAERLQGMRVTENYFAVTGARVALGRAFTDTDLDRGPVAVISDGLWKRRFGAARDIAGRTIRLNNEPHTIVGVLGPGFPFQVRDTEVITPWRPSTDPRRANALLSFLRIVGRLRDGYQPGAAEEEVDARLADYRGRHPALAATAGRARLVPIREDLTGTSPRLLSTLAAALGLVILIAVINLSNLLLADGSARTQEFATRRAVGATGGRARAQLAVEALLMAAAGLASGLVTAFVLITIVAAGAGGALPAFVDLSLTWRAVAFAAAVALLVTAASSIAPAIQSTRLTPLQAGRSVTPRARRVRAAIVCAQVTLTVVLLAATGLLVRSFVNVLRVHPGFSTDGVLTLRLSLPRPAYPTTAAVATFYDAVAPRLAALRGVQQVAAANVVPMNGYLASAGIRPPGYEAAATWPDAHYRMVSDGYLAALGIPIVEGRGFTPRDRRESQPVAIVSRDLAATYWPGSSAVGARIHVRDNGGESREVEIVGVAGNVRHLGLETASPHELYVPIAQVPDATSVWLANNMYWVVRTHGDPLALANAVKAEIREVDRGVASSFVRSMEQWLDAPLQPRRFALQIMLILAVTAVTLAFIGIWAVIAETVATRRRELALRAALGAPMHALRWAVVRDGIAAVGAGVLIGGALAAGLTRLLTAFLHGVEAHDPVTFATVVIGSAAAGSAAVFVPARAAASIDPLLSLREP